MKTDSPAVTRLDYCQYLLSSQINYTLTNFADHSEQFSHDTINRYMAGERITPHLIWENVQGQIVSSPDGYLLFDDTVADKNYSRQMGLVRRQWSGNAHAVIKGIGIVTCVYVNPHTDQFWIIDYRLYDPDGDGKSKLEHAHDMLINVVYPVKLDERSETPAISRSADRSSSLTGWTRGTPPRKRCWRLNALASGTIVR